jgi:excisionase family DNA binding protein
MDKTSNSLINYNIRSNPPSNFSVKEAAIFVGVSERLLRSVIARGEIKYVRFSSRIILRKQDLDSFLEGKVA